MYSFNTVELNNVKQIEDQTDENEIYIENWVYANDSKKVYITRIVFDKCKPKIINRSLISLQTQVIKLGIQQYRQIGYNEWIDYYVKPYTIKSENNLIQAPTISIDYITPKIGSKHHQRYRNESPTAPNNKIEETKTNSQSDLSISFEYDKKKSKQSIF
jgi:hypothetical protein